MTTDEGAQAQPQPQAQEQTDDTETIKHVADWVTSAREGGRFMIAVFSIDTESRLFCKRACYNFPTVDFDNAVNLLKTDLEKERAGMRTEPDKPMEKAEPTVPVIDLFGKKPEGDE